jgi:hypothetical protein
MGVIMVIMVINRIYEGQLDPRTSKILNTVFSPLMNEIEIKRERETWDEIEE